MTRTILILLLLAGPAGAAEPFPELAASVNRKVVKLFGAGGFNGVKGYGTGVVVSADGAILTVANSLVDTAEIVVHLPDGRRVKAAVAATEPALDLALLKLTPDPARPNEPVLADAAHFDIATSAARPLAAPGDWVVVSANSFEIAMRDEPVTVQRGVVAAVTKLSARRGIFDVTIPGEVYVVDAISNNPGAAGGALTDLEGELLGVVGREVRNAQTETWVNYAIPLQAKAEVRDGDQVRTVTVAEFVKQALAGTYKPARGSDSAAGYRGTHGVTFVPDILLRTPPYVEQVAPGSPAAKAGLKTDDLIAFLDGEPVPSVKAFRELFDRVRPGTPVRVEVRRGATLVELSLVVGPAAEPRR